MHHYFSFKRVLLEETMIWIETGLLEAMAGIDYPATAVSALFDKLVVRNSYPRLLIWMLLEGVDMTDLVTDFPAIDHLRTLLESDDRAGDARLRLHDPLLFLAGLATIDDFAAHAARMSPAERAGNYQHACRTAITIAMGQRSQTPSGTST